MPVDYKTTVSNLIKTLPFIISVTIIEGNVDIVYSTDNWNIKADISRVISSWSSMKTQPVMISGIKYLIRICINERLVATSIKGEGHIVGAKDDKRKIIVRIEPDGIIGFTYTELVRTLISLSSKGYYLDKSEQLGLKNQKIGDISSKNNQNIDNKSASIPFTSRLMAYYRAQEYKRKNPLIVDPFAEHLAGDLSSYLKEHIRYSEMDYPIVRSYYIEQNLLKPWCNAHAKSQIVLLGAGLDTRAYRFTPIQKNTHKIIEIDFAVVIRYKEDILHDEKPLCDLIRISADISDPECVSNLLNSGFSSNIPTFWVLEGLVYYMEKEKVVNLLVKSAEISAENSQIFVDIMHQSRWIPNRIIRNDLLKDSFSRHFKWGLDIKNVPSFFTKTGWNVTCSFADDHDQGRNVGQRGMIFIHGVRAIIT